MQGTITYDLIVTIMLSIGGMVVLGLVIHKIFTGLEKEADKAGRWFMIIFGLILYIGGAMLNGWAVWYKLKEDGFIQPPPVPTAEKTAE